MFIKLRHLFLLLGLMGPTKGQPPFEQSVGLYQNTLSSKQHISPFLGMVALHSGILSNIRFFGNYSARAHPSFPIHPSLAKKPNLNHPQDAISAVIQYLFPSPDGMILSHNERNKDPIGLIAREHREKKQKNNGLRKIMLLLTEIDIYQRQATKISLTESASKILNDKKTTSTSDPSGFEIITTNFSQLLAKAVDEELADKTGLYPPHIVEVALLAFAWRTANHIDEIYTEFAELFVPKSARVSPSLFSAEIYDKELNSFLNRMKPDSPPHAKKDEADERLALFLNGYNTYQTITPLLIHPQQVTYEGPKYWHTFQTCGETAWRNFLDIVWHTKGKIAQETIVSFMNKFAKTASDSSLKKLKDIRSFFKTYPEISLGTTSAAHQDWAAICSNLNTENDLIPIVYRDKICNVKGTGIPNMLNLIAHHIPDPLLLTPWSQNKKADDLVIAEKKLNRLCNLFSRDHFILNWSIKGEQKLTSVYDDIFFRVNGDQSFIWSFRDSHFDIRKSAENDWQTQPLKLPTNSWIQSWLRGHSPKIILPYDVYARNLRNPNEIMTNIDTILEKRWSSLIARIPFWIAKSVPLTDEYTLQILAIAIYGYDDVLDKLAFKEIHSTITTALEKPDFLMAVAKGAVNMGKAKTLERLCHEKRIKPKIHDCLMNEIKDIALGEILVKQGLNIDSACSLGTTPLQQAASKGNLHLAQFFIKHGAAVNGANNSGWTPLHCAAKENHRDMIRLLINHKANPNTCNHLNRTPLHMAVYWGDINLIEVLIKAGADINAQDCDNAPPLWDAIFAKGGEDNRLKVVQYLVSQGASLRFAKKGEETLIEYLKKSNQQKIAAYVESAMKSTGLFPQKDD